MSLGSMGHLLSKRKAPRKPDYFTFYLADLTKTDAICACPGTSTLGAKRTACEPLRYRGHPLPTLRSIDATGRVIYVGTFSKTLFPALRLGYVLAPAALVEVFTRFIGAYSPGVPSSPQAVVADFMEEGHFVAHIRRMRKLYEERHAALQEAAAERLAGLLEVAPTETGLHTIGRLAGPLSEQEVVERAMARGITVSPLGRYCIAGIEEKGLVLGFSGVKPEEIRTGVGVLADILDSRRKLAKSIPMPPPLPD